MINCYVRRPTAAPLARRLRAAPATAVADGACRGSRRDMFIDYHHNPQHKPTLAPSPPRPEKMSALRAPQKRRHGHDRCYAPPQSRPCLMTMTCNRAGGMPLKRDDFHTQCALRNGQGSYTMQSRRLESRAAFVGCNGVKGALPCVASKKAGPASIGLG